MKVKCCDTRSMTTPNHSFTGGNLRLNHEIASSLVQSSVAGLFPLWQG